ncbi:MAG: HmuY family protein [Polyangia bacterium]
MRLRSLALLVFVLSPLGCGGDDGGTDDGGTTADMSEAQLCAAVAPTCTDEQIQDLPLYKSASPATRTVTNTMDGTDFDSEIDAEGGGLSPTESFVYAKFTPTGLQKVDIGDEDAFASTDWDIAFRRFVVRLNSGVSGPSCVKGGRAAVGDYSTVTTVPQGLSLGAESYYSSTCQAVTDNSGLGSPGTLLATYWTYKACVAMTNNVYVIQTADGKSLKLTVEHYYTKDVQTACDTTGMMSSAQETAAAHLGVRWAYLP